MEPDITRCDLCNSTLTPEGEYPQLSQQGFIVVCDECQLNRNHTTTNTLVDRSSGATESEKSS
jgi:hypothetical protein